MKNRLIIVVTWLCIIGFCFVFWGAVFSAAFGHTGLGQAGGPQTIANAEKTCGLPLPTACIMPNDPHIEIALLGQKTVLQGLD